MSSDGIGPDVLLRPNGFFITWWEKQQKRLDLIRPRELLTYVNLDIELNDATTVGDLVRLLRMLPPEEVDRLSRYCQGLYIQPFLNESLDAREPDKDAIPLTSLVFSRLLETHKPLPSSASQEPEMTMRIECMGKDGESDERYAIDMSPMWKLAKCKLVVSPYAELVEDGIEVKAKYRMPLKLGEMLIGFFNEIAFHGSPEERDRRLADLNDRIAHMDDEPGIPAEEVFAELREQLKEKKETQK